MKKKSIFVVALAALMLIAFTACEQAVPTFGGKELVRLGVEKVSDKDYLVGQAFDPSTIRVTAYFEDGSSVVADSTKDLTFNYDFSATTVTADGTQSVQIAYQGTSTPGATYLVPVYVPTGLKISGTPSVATYYLDTVETTADVAKTGVTVAAVYNGTNEMILAENEYSLEADVSSVSTTAAVTATYLAKTAVTATAQFTVSVVADEIDTSTFAIVPTDEDFVAYNKKSFAWTDWEVTAKMKSGADATVPAISAGSNGTATVTITDVGTISLTYSNNSDDVSMYLGGAKITGSFLPEDGIKYTDTINLAARNISITADVPATISSIAWKDGEPDDLKQGARIDPALITFTTTWKSNHTYTGTDGDVAPTVTFSVIPTTVQEKAGESQPVWISVPASYGDVEITNNGQLSFTVAANE